MVTLPDIPINIEWFGLVSKISWIMLYVVLIGLAGGIIYAVFLFMQFNIKVTYWPLYGSGKDGVFSIGKRAWNRAMWVKKRTAWRMLFPLMNKVDIKPFDAEFIYPGRQVYAYKLNQEYGPARHNVMGTLKEVLQHTKLYTRVPLPSSNPGYEYVEVMDVFPYIPINIGGNLAEKLIRGSLDAVPYEMKNWYNAKLKENELEFREENWWSANKQFILAIGTTLICGVMLVACAYLVYKMVSAGRDTGAGLTRALQSFTETLRGGGGAAPPG